MRSSAGNSFKQFGCFIGRKFLYDRFLCREVEDLENAGSPVNAHVADDLRRKFGKLINKKSNIADVLVIQKFACFQYILLANDFKKIFLYIFLFYFRYHASNLLSILQHAEDIAVLPELDVLSNLASISVAGRSAIVAVTGEPGIGKSRLVHEVVTTMMTRAPTPSCWKACAPRTASRTCGGRWPVELLGRLGLDRNSPPDEARDRVVRRLEPFEEFGQGSPEFDHVVEVVMHLLGHPSAIDALGPSAVRDAVFGGLTFALRRRATQVAGGAVDRRPAVGRSAAARPARVDGATPGRPPAAHPHHVPPRGGGHHRLAASGRSGTDPASAAVADVRLGSGGSREHRRRAYVARDDGAVDLGPCRWQPVVHHRARPAGGRVPRRSRRPGVPRSLRALIAARLDQLTRSQRAVLDNASILGVEGRVASLDRSPASSLSRSTSPTSTCSSSSA